jgi:hypothetical protein
MAIGQIDLFFIARFPSKCRKLYTLTPLSPRLESGSAGSAQTRALMPRIGHPYFITE